MAQAYMVVASLLFLTGHVLKDPMQNALYLTYALTLPFVSGFIFLFFNYRAVKSKNILFGAINLFNFLSLAAVFFFRMVV